MICELFITLLPFYRHAKEMKIFCKNFFYHHSSKYKTILNMRLLSLLAIKTTHKHIFDDHYGLNVLVVVEIEPQGDHKISKLSTRVHVIVRK